MSRSALETASQSSREHYLWLQKKITIMTNNVLLHFHFIHTWETHYLSQCCMLWLSICRWQCWAKNYFIQKNGQCRDSPHIAVTETTLVECIFLFFSIYSSTTREPVFYSDTAVGPARTSWVFCKQGPYNQRVRRYPTRCSWLEKNK